MLETKRLQIRLLKQSDIDDMFEYVGDPDVMKYENDQYMNYDKLKQLIDYMIEHKSMFVVLEKRKSKVIGQIYLGLTNPTFNNEYSLGYIFNPLYQGKGYCTEASKAIVDYGFEILKANRIKAACNPVNIPSWRVMEKIGMKKEGFFEKKVHFRDDEQGNPIYWDEYVYGMNILDWKKNR